jgi:site-specific recombinase XerD
MASIRKLESAAERYLADHGYSEATVNDYRKHWQRVEDYCESEGIEDYGKEQEHALIGSTGLLANDLSERKKRFLRAVKCLLSISESGNMPPVLRKPRAELPLGKGRVLESYTEHLEQRRLASGTVRTQTGIMRRFLAWLPAEDITTLSVSDVAAYMESNRPLAPQTKACVLYAIRAFARWASGEGLCSDSTAAAMAVIPGHRHSELPSAYHSDEVAAAVALAARIGGRCPKRNRAMLLLASVLAMRAGDIRELSLGDIDWREHTVCFRQGKTGTGMTLPMPDEVVLALVDYLKNERPLVKDDHVFVSAVAPYSNFSKTTDTFYRVASRAYGFAGVSTTGKHHGMHSLRHSSATCMLDNGVAYPVIAGVLGHAEQNTTMTYLAIDSARLRALCLEVPHG